MTKDKLLYIGLNGLAGSGKDTVAKMLKAILVQDWNNIEECKEYYNKYFSQPGISATFTNNNPYKFRVYAIAFADQLKEICSTIFGIPVERFYNNKSNAWICINKDFHYTEIRPDNVITCEEYYYNCSEYRNSDTPYWLSLRDILVYIGTYVLQQDVNKDVFTNIVQNRIRSCSANNPMLKYVIVTDIRFEHELDYVRKHNGITIKITKPDVTALDNVAEHDLDDEDNYTFTIDNDGTCDELFVQVWNLVHDNVIFKNITQQLATRDDVDNYLRQIDDNVWEICTPYNINRVQHSEGDMTMIDIVGGPTIYVNEEIPGTDLIASSIELDNDRNTFIITTEQTYEKNDEED